MSSRYHPRRGSLQYSPRVRAKRIYPRVRHVPVVEGKNVVEFAGYKVGMLQVDYIEKRKNRFTNREVVEPATLIEAPPLKVLAARFYEKTPYGSRTVTELWSDKIENNVARKITGIKPNKDKDSVLDKIKEGFDKIKLIVATQPKLAGIGKKAPEVFEIHYFPTTPLPSEPSSDNSSQLLDEISSLLGNEICVGDVFAPGVFVDVITVTKGKGFQGSVKRFGVKLLSHKARKIRRKAGTLGPWHPAKTRWTVPQTGQMGFHTRTEFNKWVIEVGDEPSRVSKSGGWKHYGVVKSDYIILHGSVPGPSKRLIRLRYAIRCHEPPTEAPEIKQLIW